MSKKIPDTPINRAYALGWVDGGDPTNRDMPNPFGKVIHSKEALAWSCGFIDRWGGKPGRHDFERWEREEWPKIRQRHS